MKRRLRIGLTVLFILAVMNPGIKAAVQDSAGMQAFLDLRQPENESRQIYSLSGTWEFYWEQLLTPADFSQPDAPHPDLLVAVPSYWSGYKLNGKKLSRFGYGSYRLRILLPPLPGDKDTLALLIPVFDTSYELFLNGKKVASNGKTGRSAEESEPGYRPLIHVFTPESDTLDLLVQVSNYSHRRGGFWKNMYLGQAREIRKMDFRSQTSQEYSQAILLAFALFFIIFQVLLQKDRVMIYFALALLGIYFRSLSTDHYFISQFFSISWSNLIRLEYLSTYLAYIFGAWYLYNLFPTAILKKLTYVNCAIMLVLALMVVFMPVNRFAYTITLFQLISTTLFAYYLIRSMLGMFRKRVYDTVYFINFLIIIYGEVHDFMLSQSVVMPLNGYIMPYVLLIFAFIQASMLIAQWVEAFKKTEKLHAENIFINENLEKIVQERTIQLNEKNRQLEDSIELKNRLFSIIAHDLKSPIGSLQQFTDLVLAEDSVKNQKKILRTIRQMTNSVIHLIDNLIFWGMSQNNQINYQPFRGGIKTSVNSVLKTLEENAALKEIVFDDRSDPDMVAYFDPQLLEISLRNVITNSLKFTQKGGKILVLTALEENENRVRITVQDTGVGMVDKKLEEIMSGKKTESEPGTSSEKGTGLGLSLVFDLMRINRGTVEINSTPGEGTAVHLYLPLNPPVLE
ncbi:MAG: ATP-binding protein [Bacteroidota bacterium]